MAPGDVCPLTSGRGPHLGAPAGRRPRPVDARARRVGPDNGGAHGSLEKFTLNCSHLAAHDSARRAKTTPAARGISSPPVVLDTPAARLGQPACWPSPNWPPARQPTPHIHSHARAQASAGPIRLATGRPLQRHGHPPSHRRPHAPASLAEPCATASKRPPPPPCRCLPLQLARPLPDNWPFTKPNKLTLTQPAALCASPPPSPSSSSSQPTPNCLFQAKRADKLPIETSTCLLACPNKQVLQVAN